MGRRRNTMSAEHALLSAAAGQQRRSSPTNGSIGGRGGGGGGGGGGDEATPRSSPLPSPLPPAFSNSSSGRFNAAAFTDEGGNAFLRRASNGRDAERWRLEARPSLGWLPQQQSHTAPSRDAADSTAANLHMHHHFGDLRPTLDRFADDTSMLGFRYLHSRYKNWFRYAYVFY